MPLQATGRLADFEDMGSDPSDTTVVVAVLKETALARSVEEQLQVCCPWALVPIPTPNENLDGTDDEEEAGT